MCPHCLGKKPPPQTKKANRKSKKNEKATAKKANPKSESHFPLLFVFCVFFRFCFFNVFCSFLCFFLLVAFSFACGRRRVLLATALSLWRRAQFGTWVSLSWQAQGKLRVLVLQSRLFVTGARDRSIYFEMQFSWQVQHFGHAGDRQGAQIS